MVSDRFENGNSENDPGWWREAVDGKGCQELAQAVNGVGVCAAAKVGSRSITSATIRVHGSRFLNYRM